jgi:AcrR family transcriptional regulator
VVEARRPYDIDSLTDVALRVFAERGYDGASMDDVARAAGITKATIYHHVPGKEALLERGLRRALDALFAVLDESSARDGAAIDRVRHIALRVAVITCELLPEVSVLFRVRGNSDVEREAIERRRKFDRIVSRLLAQAQAAGDVRPDIDPAVATRLIFGMSNSVVEWYRAGGRIDRDELASAIVRVAFAGIAQ